MSDHQINQKLKNKNIVVACYGEMLWDVFPGKTRRAGGAPFNVAYHLSKLGVDARMISAVGNDEPGMEILSKMNGWNMPVANVRVSNSFPTSTVTAVFDMHNEAHYDITNNVAWDNIALDEAAQRLVDLSDAFVFGSLASRNRVSKGTLFSLLELSHFNVFDINLRQPYYDLSVIKDLLSRSHLVKLNKAELLLLLEHLGRPYRTEQDGILFLQDTFKINEIIISKGSKGAIYASKTGMRLYPAIAINVADTVGSGDAFLAGFLSNRLHPDLSEEDVMRQAIALGAYVTSQNGACPDYHFADFLEFKNSRMVDLNVYNDLHVVR